jgi:acyl-coenzyme A synthetase/AMP-(fatty) acid ligase
LNSACQIETAILEHPGVKEVAVVGSADETYGEIVCAFLVLRDVSLYFEVTRQRRIANRHFALISQLGTGEKRSQSRSAA